MIKKVFTKLFIITYKIERNKYCKKLRLLKVYMFTWSYENRVSKHFVIFLNFPCLIACLLCCLLMSFFLLVLWLGICVEVDVDRITILPRPPRPPRPPPTRLPMFFPTHNSFFNTKIATRPETQITHTRGGRQSLAPVVFFLGYDVNGSKRLSPTPMIIFRA